MITLLAKICQCCPFCIARRKWPNSRYGKFMSNYKKYCPFCKAYDQLHSPSAKTGDTEPQ
ncbi:MAG: hypothetical protein C4527_10240 [Candidatus Omnitrophota bacterium]|nr:MAG: hypothetical protein C4527_10240 [Candidatus Omnitrophota bacterium]